MLCVLSLDFPAAGVLPPPLGDETAVEVLHRPVPVGTEQTGVLVDGLVELADCGRPVLLLHPAHRSGEATRLVRLLRQVLGARIAAVPTLLPPLAAGVLVDILARLAEPLELDAGRAAAAVPEIEARLAVRCWVRTVAGLAAPTPSLVQHLLSGVAWRGFEVEVRPEPGVRWVRKGARPSPLPGGTVVAVRGEERDLARLQPEGVRTVESPGVPAATRQWFGTGRVAEAVAFPADLDALARAVAARIRYGDCGWCGLPGPAGPCAFCGIARPVHLSPRGVAR